MANEHLHKWPSAAPLPFQEKLAEATSMVSEQRAISAYSQDKLHRLWLQRYEPLKKDACENPFVSVIVLKTNTCTVGMDTVCYQRVLSREM